MALRKKWDTTVKYKVKWGGGSAIRYFEKDGFTNFDDAKDWCDIYAPKTGVIYKVTTKKREELILH